MKLCVVCKQEINGPKQRKLCYNKTCWRIRNRQQTDRWQRNNHDKVLQSSNKWKSKNPDLVKKHNEKRKHTIKNKIQQVNYTAKRKGAVGSITVGEWNLLLWLFKGCAYCGSKEKYLTVDHAVPLSKGGSNYIENILPACFWCNVKKKDMLNYDPEDISYVG